MVAKNKNITTKTQKVYGKSINVATNAQQVLTNISNMIREVKHKAEDMAEWSARELVNDARQNLQNSGYSVERLLPNITWAKNKAGYYTVSIENNSEKDVMYYLEYGTGLVGQGKIADKKDRKGEPHPLATEAHWAYGEGKNIKYPMYNFSDKNKGGWYYEDDKGNIRFTKGLRAIAYLYNAFKGFDKPNGPRDRAEAKTKIKSIIKAGR